ncbi:MAG TPA: hypothetical protein VK548_26360 [Candidatus Acidoferrum sp.]|nr:hypothetical protein [Candidatus Acidoferrum sp.]
MGLKVALLVVCLLTMAAVPATAQLADPLSLAASGVLLPFFSDPAAGFVSVLEIASPVVPTTLGFNPPFNFTNPIHAVFFTQTCARNKSIADVETAKQAKAYITTASPFTLDFNGLAAIGNTLTGNDLIPLNFPLHTRTHWIDAKTGRLRELEPIILDTFLTLAPGFLPLVENPGAGASIGLCAPGAGVFAGSINNGFCWSPLRTAATFVTPQETASLKASIYLICPSSSIQSSAGTGVFPIAAGFPRIQNRDGTFGFPSNGVVSGTAVTQVRGRIYNDDESGPKDFVLGCTCLSISTVASIDSIYSTAPVNLGAHTVPVWYTELEAQSVNPNPVVAGSAQFFSFTGYWGLEVTGREATLFHRMSNASLDNLSFGTFNPFANR